VAYVGVMGDGRVKNPVLGFDVLSLSVLLCSSQRERRTAVARWWCISSSHCGSTSCAAEWSRPLNWGSYENRRHTTRGFALTVLRCGEAAGGEEVVGYACVKGTTPVRQGTGQHLPLTTVCIK